MTHSFTLHLRGARFALAAIIAAAACAPQPGTRPEPPRVEPDQQARALAAAGDYAAAAEQWLRLAAAARGEQAERYRLAAAEAWLDAGQAQRARDLVDALRIADGARDTRARLALVRARLALAEGEARTALDLLGRIRGAQLDARLKQAWLRARAEALEATGAPLQAARARAELEPLLDGPARETNAQALWRALEEVPAARLEQALSDSATANLAGWLELGLLAQTRLHERDGFRAGLQAWRARFPAHPALATVVPELLEIASTLAVMPARVALLLPLQGPFADAGAAVRDGFISAWYADPDPARRPTVSVLHGAVDGIAAAYDRAVAAGAEYIVGPLEKAALETLVQARTFTVPVLALNRVDAPADGPLFQFALAPEDEARQVAERAWFDGRVQALAIRPAGEWGERVLEAFAQRWRELGGELLEAGRFDPDSGDFAPPSRRLLNVDGSEQRAAALRQLLQRELEFEPRRRQDADFVFMAAFPVQARQIKPQLEYFRAANLPVYATSHVFSGTADVERDRDLDGVVFADMPWLLDPRVRDQGLYRTLQSNWPDAARAWPRLHALGIDAYRLLGQIGRLRVQRHARLHGQTGTLGLDRDGRIHRQLTWARFADGRPRLLDATLAER